MKSIRLCVLAVIAATATPSYAQQVFHQQHQCCYGCTPHMGCHYSYVQNVLWPCQFVPTAQRSVFAANAAMANNGWRRQNLLGAYHFDAETNELTDAGKMKVRWILTQSPAHRRMVYVERGLSEEQTAIRIAAIQNMSAGMSPPVASVDVNDTHIVAEGHPASDVDATFIGFTQNRLPPVLPSDTGSSSGGSE